MIMAGWKDRLALAVQRNRQEIIEAKLNRREMIRMGLITASGTLGLKQGLSARWGIALADDGSRLGFVEWNPLPIPRHISPRSASAMYRCTDESWAGHSDNDCRRTTADSCGTRLSFA